MHILCIKIFKKIINAFAIEFPCNLQKKYSSKILPQNIIKYSKKYSQKYYDGKHTKTVTESKKILHINYFNIYLSDYLREIYLYIICILYVIYTLYN